MNSRRLTIALCSILCGLLFGVAAVFTSQPSFAASKANELAYRIQDFPQVQKYPTRALKGIQVFDLPGAGSGKSVPGTLVKPALQTTCDIVRSIASDLQLFVEHAIPARKVLLPFRNPVLEKLQNLSDKFCQTEDDGQQSGRVNNHCGKYIIRSRYTSCLRMQEAGQTYP